jgi:hypothetical protein
MTASRSPRLSSPTAPCPPCVKSTVCGATGCRVRSASRRRVTAYPVRPERTRVTFVDRSCCSLSLVVHSNRLTRRLLILRPNQKTLLDLGIMSSWVEPQYRFGLRKPVRFMIIWIGWRQKCDSSREIGGFRLADSSLQSNPRGCCFYLSCVSIIGETKGIRYPQVATTRR